MTDPADMTPEQLRVEIAEWCGWEKTPLELRAKAEADGGRLMIWWKPHWSDGDDIPNYPADLNAMAEAEKKLRESARMRGDYGTALMEICANDQSDGRQYGRETWNASAHQRAIAFVRVIRG